MRQAATTSRAGRSADFIAPTRQRPAPIIIGAFAVTTGIGCEELCDQFDADHDDYNAIMAKALADRLAEAFAEYLHKRVRDEWGFGRDEKLTTDDLIEEKYRGIRPAAGYPACPDHTEKGTLWHLLDVEAHDRHPAHRIVRDVARRERQRPLLRPPARPRYFASARSTATKSPTISARKGMTVAEVERWLGPNLNYDPATPGG